MTDDANISLQDALNRLAALHGKFVWLSSIEIDFVLRFEIGDPRLRVEEKLLKAIDAEDPAALRRIVRPVGEWSLFVGTGLWQVRHGRRDLQRLNATYSDNSISVRRHLTQLDGQKIRTIRWDIERLEWIFEFDLGASLAVRADVHETGQSFSEQWTVFSIRGGSISCLRNDQMLLEGEF